MDPDFLISKAKAVKDPFESKALILMAKTLYPGNFNIQFETYLMEKNNLNYQEAAKCFGYIVMNFHNQPALWDEIKKLIEVLKEEKTGQTESEQEFYIQLFQNISYEVQQEIMKSTAEQIDNNFDRCRIILLLLKKFPQALNISTHAPHLLDILIQGMKTSPAQFKEILVQEALPLLKNNPPTDLPIHLVHKILSITIEYYMTQMFVEAESNEYVVEENWSKIFDALELCGRMLKWENLYVPYQKNYSKDFYWQKLIQMVSANVNKSAENKQVVFCTSVLFFLSLQDYINLSRIKENDIEIQHILVEGFVDYLASDKLKRRKHDEVPQISIPPTCSSELSTSFNVATNCYKLLQTDESWQYDFGQLVISMPPISNWINRFLLDLSIFMGRPKTEAFPNIEKNQSISKLEKILRFLSYSAQAENPLTFAVEACEYIVSILAELPRNDSGSFVKNLTMSSGRHLVLLPMTKRAIVQYCVQIIVNGLKHKLVTDTNSSDNLLGNLLVLLQLEFSQGPQDTFLVETIFEVIRNRRNFCYLLFPNYIINIDFVEEFMNMWHTGDVKLEFVMPANQRRIGTRGADKGVKEDFKQIISQQVLRCNDDIVNLMIHFLQQEHLKIVQCLFENV